MRIDELLLKLHERFDVVYCLIMIAAVSAAAVLSRWTQGSLPMTRSEKTAVGIGGFCGAMIAAKLPFVLSDWDGMMSGIAWFSDGKTIVCGLVGGYLGVETAKWCFDIRIKTGDGFAVPVATAIGIGRLGCFHAGCCYGIPTDSIFGVVFQRVDLLPRHPTQLYETTFHLSMALLLWFMWRRSVFRYNLFKFYLVSYMIYRFITEFIRPEAQLWFGLTGYQWGTMALTVLFLWLWRRDRQRAVSDFMSIDGT